MNRWDRLYNLGKPGESRHQGGRRLPCLVYGVEDENEVKVLPVMRVFQHAAKLNVQLGQGLASLGDIFRGPLQGFGDRGDNGLE